MDRESVELLLALLTVAAWVALAGLVVLEVGARSGHTGAGRLRADLRAALADQGLGLALVVATVATAGSLYLSEVAHFVPCELCWYQRIAMYPLVPMLAQAAWRRDRSIRPYVVAPCLLGGAVSAWHLAVERITSLQDGGGCDPVNPCWIRWVDEWGFVTIPLMALSAFALIVALVALTPGPGDGPPTVPDELTPALEELR